MSASYQAEVHLERCIRELVEFVTTQSETGRCDAEGPAFAYLLTQKQADEIDRVCDASGWGRINCYGVLIAPKDIRHILTARASKDGLTAAEVAAIVIRAYNPRSLLRNNPLSQEHGDFRRSSIQSVMLNTHQKLLLGGSGYYGVAILEIRQDGARRYLAPVTCYHATEAKKRRILK